MNERKLKRMEKREMWGIVVAKTRELIIVLFYSLGSLYIGLDWT